MIGVKMTHACNVGNVWTCGFVPAVGVIGPTMEKAVGKVRITIVYLYVCSKTTTYRPLDRLLCG